MIDDSMVLCVSMFNCIGLNAILDIWCCNDIGCVAIAVGCMERGYTDVSSILDQLDM